MRTEEQYQMPLYILKKDIPLAKAGTIFYYDRHDKRLGSIGAGCLKMAWTRDGNCQNALCADTIVFHADAIERADWFEPVEPALCTPMVIHINGELYRKVNT